MRVWPNTEGPEPGWCHRLVVEIGAGGIRG
jgi:hypothetical protein